MNKIKLPLFIWKILKKNIKETTGFEKALNIYVSLIDTTEILRLSKKDKVLFPVLKNLCSDVQVLEKAIKECASTAPKSKSEMYGFLAHYIEAINIISYKMMEKFDNAEGNVLTEKEQNLSWDYTVILEQLHEKMLENPKNLGKIIKGLQTEFSGMGFKE